MIQARLQISGQINGRENLTGGLNTSIKEIKPELENLKVIPKTEQQEFKSEKYGYDEVIVEPVTSSIDEDIKSENIKKGINILGVEGGYEGIDTSDATATPNDILVGKTAYVNNEKVEGTIEIYDGVSEGGTTENEYNAIVITRPIGMLTPGAIMVKMPTIDCSEVENLDFAFNFCMAKEYDLINFQHLDSMISTFMNCAFMIETPQIDTNSIKYMDEMFRECYSLEKVNYIDTSNAVSMAGMFMMCEQLKEVPLLDFRNAINIESMFCECKSLKTIPSFNTQKVENMGFLFNNCIKLEDVPQLDASYVIRVSKMFDGCESLINLGGLLNLGKSYTEKKENYYAYELDLSSCQLLTHESLMNIINNLYDLNLTYDVANGGTLYTQSLNLGSINKAKLTADEIRNSDSKADGLFRRKERS